MKERPQRQARYAVSIEYKMVRADIHRRPTSWNVRLCAIDDSPLCLRLVPLFFMAHPFISFTSLSSLPDPYPQKALEIEERINNCPLRVHVSFSAQPSGDLREIKMSTRFLKLSAGDTKILSSQLRFRDTPRMAVINQSSPRDSFPIYFGEIKRY